MTAVAELPAEFQIRPATIDDAAAISSIYNHYVVHTSSTFQTMTESLEDRQRWLSQRGELHPVIVCQHHEQIVGWAALSVFSPRQAFARTAEVAIYLHDQWLGRGIGKCLLSRIIELGRQANHHVLVSTICTEQEASLNLHRRCGFTETGRLHQVGWKFDRWLDLAYLQLTLD